MKYFLLVAVVLVLAASVVIWISGRAEFMAGGALVNLGFRLQDHLEPYDPDGDLKLTPEQIFRQLIDQNDAASKVRRYFPRTARHPLVAMVVCMDARIDTNELVGDTRKYYYVIRTAGSVLSSIEQDMLQLAVENGVKVIMLTTHSNCAAEKAARDPELRARYPYLAQAVDERAQRTAELLKRPAIASRIAKSELVVKQVHIDTSTAHITLEESPKAP